MAVGANEQRRLASRVALPDDVVDARDAGGSPRAP